MKMSDTVSVLIPLKAEYVSVTRLTASGIASHMGFDFDTIEDIKVALSEVLSKIIEKRLSEERITIEFTNTGDGLSIAFILANQTGLNLFDGENDNFALAIIQSLMDEVDFNQNENIVMTMTKKLGKAV